MINNIQSSVNHPFLWFENLLFHHGYEIELERFIYDAEMIDAIYNNSELSLIYNEQNEFGEWEQVKEYFKSRLRRILFEERKMAILYLDENLRKLDDNESKKKSTNQMLDTLQGLLNGASSSRFNDIINFNIISMIEHIRTRYQHLHLTHKVFKIVFRLTRTVESTSFFGAEKLKYKTLKELCYNIFCEDFLDEIMVEDELFNVLISPEPQNENIGIYFAINNQEVAYLLREMEPLFTNLNFDVIGASQCFFNKKGKLLTSGDLYTALSDFIKDKKTIDGIYPVKNGLRNIILNIRSLISQLQ